MRTFRSGRSEEQNRASAAKALLPAQHVESIADLRIATEEDGRIFLLEGQQTGVRRRLPSQSKAFARSKPAFFKPRHNRSKPSSRAVVRSMIWISRSTGRILQGAIFSGRICLPNARAWVISAKHQSDAIECSLHNTATARQTRSWA
jgi:hypothetical protein